MGAVGKFNSTQFGFTAKPTGGGEGGVGVNIRLQNLDFVAATTGVENTTNQTRIGLEAC